MPSKTRFLLAQHTFLNKINPKTNKIDNELFKNQLIINLKNGEWRWASQIVDEYV